MSGQWDRLWARQIFSVHELRFREHLLGGAWLEEMRQPSPDFPLPEWLPHRLLLNPPYHFPGWGREGQMVAADAIDRRKPVLFFED